MRGMISVIIFGGMFSLFSPSVVSGSESFIDPKATCASLPIFTPDWFVENNVRVKGIFNFLRDPQTQVSDIEEIFSNYNNRHPSESCAKIPIELASKLIKNRDRALGRIVHYLLDSLSIYIVKALEALDDYAWEKGFTARTKITEGFYYSVHNGKHAYILPLFAGSELAGFEMHWFDSIICPLNKTTLVICDRSCTANYNNVFTSPDTIYYSYPSPIYPGTKISVLLTLVPPEEPLKIKDPIMCRHY